MLSRRMDTTKEDYEVSSPLFKLAILESYEPVFTDASLIENIKIATSKDKTLQSILAFFMNGPHKAPVDACC